MSILVTGATGTIGSRVATQLLERGIAPRILSRSPAQASRRFPAAEVVEGDLISLETSPDAWAGVDQVVLITPLSENEVEQGMAALRGASRAGVSHAVLLSVHQVERGSHIPHFRSKIELASEARRLGLTLTEVMPNNFYQNDYWFKDAILQWGVYPQPLGSSGISRVDAGDIAHCIVRTLLQPDLQGDRYPLAGPAPLTGESVADEYSRALGRTIRYGGDDLEAWAQQSRQYLPGWLVDDLAAMYAFFQVHGLVATDAELEEQARVLGRAPRPFRDFVVATCRQWEAAG